MRLLFALVLCVGAFYTTSCARSHPKLNGKMGVHTAQYEDTERDRPILVEIWYPTNQAGPLDLPEDAVWEHPQEVRDVPIAEGKYPVIFMSHGHGGDRRDRSWLAEHLVNNGFIVASVEHYGNAWRTYNPRLTLRFWERAKDVSFAISALLKDPMWQNFICPERIGFVGYSLGGMTGLALGGAKPQNLKELALQYFKKYEGADAITLDMVEETDFSEGQQNFADSRIHAFALLSPAAFGIPPESLQEVKTPVALVASEEDEVLPHQEHALKIVEFVKPAKLKLFRKHTSHYVFLNRVSEAGKQYLRSDIQTNTIQTDRIKVHAEVGHFLVTFFQEYLK